MDKKCLFLLDKYNKNNNQAIIKILTFFTFTLTNSIFKIKKNLN